MANSAAPSSVPPAPLRLQVTSDAANIASVRRAVEAYSLAAGFDEASVGQIGLVVNEAIANIIRHAYHGESGRPIEVTAEPLEASDGAGTTLRLRLRDWGSGVDPNTCCRGYVLGEPGGLGLICLRSLMDKIEFAAQPDGGMLLTMVKKKPPREDTKR